METKSKPKNENKKTIENKTKYTSVTTLLYVSTQS